MKISKSNENININDATDFMELVNDLQEKYGTIFWNTIDDETFIYRALGRAEYIRLLSEDISNEEKEDVVCKACLLYPTNYDFDNCLAGIPKQLNDYILRNSFLDSLESKKAIINYERMKMQEFDNQITCIINEAFPNIDIEEIENWDMSKTAKYLSRAEWKLNVLRQMPIDYDRSDELLENEWITQHNINTEPVQEKENNINVEKEESTFRVETLEEREARLKNKPRRKSREEIEALKRRFPEIDWSSEVDPNENIDLMRDSVDVTSPALRPGF